MTVSPPPASGKFLRIERDGSPGRCGARRSGRGSFERVVRVRSVGGDGDGARKSLGTACAPDSAPRADVLGSKTSYSFSSREMAEDIHSDVSDAHTKFGIFSNGKQSLAPMRERFGIGPRFAIVPARGRRLVRNGRFAPICQAFSNGGLSLHRTSQRNTHTRSHGNARVVTSDGVE